MKKQTKRLSFPWGSITLLILVAAAVLFFMSRKEDPRAYADRPYLEEWAFIPGSGNIYACMMQSITNRDEGTLCSLVEYDPLADTILTDMLVPSTGIFRDHFDVFPSGDGVCVIVTQSKPEYISYVYYYETGFAEPKLVSSNEYLIADIYLTRDRLAAQALRREDLRECLLFIEQDSLKAFDLGTTGDMEEYDFLMHHDNTYDITNLDIPLILKKSKDEQTAWRIIGLFPDRKGELPSCSIKMEDRDIAAHVSGLLDETFLNVRQKELRGHFQLYTYSSAALQEVSINHYAAQQTLQPINATEAIECSFDTSQYVLRFPQLSFGDDSWNLSGKICNYGKNESVVFGTRGQLTGYWVERNPFAVKADLTPLLKDIKPLTPRPGISNYYYNIANARVEDNRLMMEFSTRTNEEYYDSLACYAIDMNGGRPVRLSALELENVCSKFWEASFWDRMFNW